MEIAIGFSCSLAVVLIVPTYIDRVHQIPGNDWYRKAIQPNIPIAPPTWVFPVIWTLLYVFMAAAIGLWASLQPQVDWQSDMFIATFVLFGCNLLFNRLWTLIFFSFRDQTWSVSLALLDAFLIFGTAVAVVVLFHLSSVTNGWIFGLWYPYIAWTGFAFALTLLIWLRVRDGSLNTTWVDLDKINFEQ